MTDSNDGSGVTTSDLLYRIPAPLSPLKALKLENRQLQHKIGSLERELASEREECETWETAYNDLFAYHKEREGGGDGR